MASHHDDPAAAVFLRNFVPFTAAWLAAAAVFGTYRPVSNRSLVLTVVVAIPVAVLLRVAWGGVWVARDVLTFALVALVFASVFVGAGRVLSAAMATWLAGRPARRPQ
jgi:hypothetical protein